MILIDTSAWVQFLRPKGNNEIKQRIKHLIQEDEAAISCPIYFELVAGAREHELADLQDVLSLTTRFLFLPEHWHMAAMVEQRLRRKYLTIKRDDILIATIAHAESLPLLCRDKHFPVIRDKGDLHFEIEQMS